MIRFVIIACMIVLLSCSNDQLYSYDTHADHKRLSELQGKSLALLYYSHDESALIGTDVLESSFASTVNKKLKAKLVEKFYPLFNLVDLSGGKNKLNSIQQYVDVMKKKRC